MKKTIAVLSALMTAAVFAGAENDLAINFSTPGPDTYADGTPVLDHEYYALVWTAADGKQTLVRYAQLAKGGKCEPVVFIVRESEMAQFTDGTWGVYLLDTRVFGTDAEGKTVVTGLAGSITGENVKVAVSDGIVGSAGTIASADAAASVSPESYNLEALGVPAPRVTKIQIDNANVVVTVADTVPFVRYTLQSGSDVASFSVPANADEANGNSGGEIKLVTPKENGSQFFKVSTTAVK